MEREIAGMRCLMVEASLSVDRYHWRALRLKDDGASEREIKNDPGVRQWEKLANALTPMQKYYIAETANSVIYDALQVLGGAGFIEEYDLARLYRDVRITNIYDGTTQIQVNAAIGGIVSGMSEKGNLREYFTLRFGEFPASDLLNELRSGFEEIVKLYKDLPDADRKAEYSFEVVQSATRLLIGVLLERTAHKLSGEEKDARLQLAYQYNVDSEAILSGNRIKLKRAPVSAAAPVAAAG